MKAIFLDFDGVIRIPVMGGPKIEAEFCGERMKRVAEFSKDSGARIVISSDWRQRYDRVGMENLLQPHIPRELLHTDWMTPVLASVLPSQEFSVTVPRGAEILAWLASNPEVRQFVILDDMHSKYFPLMRERLVSCQLLDGFTEERSEKARAILSGVAE